MALNIFFQEIKLVKPAGLFSFAWKKLAEHK